LQDYPSIDLTGGRQPSTSSVFARCALLTFFDEERVKLQSLSTSCPCSPNQFRHGLIPRRLEPPSTLPLLDCLIKLSFSSLFPTEVYSFLFYGLAPPVPFFRSVLPYPSPPGVRSPGRVEHLLFVFRDPPLFDFIIVTSHSPFSKLQLRVRLRHVRR